MKNILDLQTYRNRIIEEKSFSPWQKRFGETFEFNTHLADLSDKTLYFLAQPGEQCAMAYYEIIMGALDLGPAIKFDYLEATDQMQVVDIQFFLADQIRFELMRRLQWLTGFEAARYPLLEMIQQFDTVKAACAAQPPELSASHPGHDEYQQLVPGDQQVFIRRMLPDALATFTINKGGRP
ncbi:MAG: hypothetical protein CSA20_09765 [Deltaproteobacteria bacterium]|nr:MAG: hypothetical protein CSA20_09765 [Deltaproteobacteria bacterium]